MALLSTAMRASAFTGSTAPVTAWLAGRQTGWWSSQYGRPAGSVARSPRSGARAPESLRSLTELRERGVIDETEFDALRERLGI